MSTVDDEPHDADATNELERVLPRELLESDRCPGPGDRPYIRHNRLIEYNQKINGVRMKGLRPRYDHPEFNDRQTLAIEKELFLCLDDML